MLYVTFLLGVVYTVHTIIIQNNGFYHASRALSTTTKASRVGGPNFSSETKGFVGACVSIVDNENIGTDTLPLSASHWEN